MTWGGWFIVAAAFVIGALAGGKFTVFRIERGFRDGWLHLRGGFLVIDDNAEPDDINDE